MVVENLLEPPVDKGQAQRGNWQPVAENDPVASYISQNLREGQIDPRGWEIAGLSHAVYLYREISGKQTIAAKFYAAKTGDSAMKYARQEFNLTELAGQALSGEKTSRAVRALDIWRGILFLEYVDGLTLEDVIAVRRSRPGSLRRHLSQSARLLARLHGSAVPQLAYITDFDGQVRHIRKILRNLAKHGVLQGDTILQNGMEALIQRWEMDKAMYTYIPVLAHGDATTTNFIFTTQGDIVGIDWERTHLADPASDLGRVLAEISHSINQHGGNVAEAEPLAEFFQDCYLGEIPASWDAAALTQRGRFYQALSTLRIARNGWVPRLARTTLVAQAFALLAL